MKTFSLGKPTRERWNVGVFAPGWVEPDGEFNREGDFLYVGMASYSDQDLNRSGYTSSAQLLRDGVVVAENPDADCIFADLPPEEATYTFRTAITGEWTFPGRPSRSPTTRRRRSSTRTR